jgi:predicted ATPase
MPTKQFLVTMDFVKSGLWLGKNRKNGDVYKALKKFYIKKGIIKDKK